MNSRTRAAVLEEAGYVCAAPTCGAALVLHAHHIVHAASGGGDTIDNLVALCPRCHGLYHEGHIQRAAVGAWKLALRQRLPPSPASPLVDGRYLVAVRLDEAVEIFSFASHENRICFLADLDAAGVEWAVAELNPN